jgi:hypothetical protein
LRSERSFHFAQDCSRAHYGGETEARSHDSSAQFGNLVQLVAIPLANPTQLRICESKTNRRVRTGLCHGNRAS